jgi:protein KTI12
LILAPCSSVFVPELRRHKRAFLKLATKMAYSRVSDAAMAQRLFADYLRQQDL